MDGNVDLVILSFHIFLFQLFAACHGYNQPQSSKVVEPSVTISIVHLSFVKPGDLYLDHPTAKWCSLVTS